MSDRRANTRIRVLVLLFAAVFAIALGRAAWIQVVDGSGYAAMASRQHRETIEIPAGRGTIYDRTGTPLAIGEQATTVYADPRHVVAPAKAAVKAGETLGLDPDKLYPSLRDRTKRFVFVDRKADPVKAKALQQMGVAGFGFYPEERRFYPQAEVASHLLGFAGMDNKGLDGPVRAPPIRAPPIRAPTHLAQPRPPLRVLRLPGKAPDRTVRRSVVRSMIRTSRCRSTT